MLYRRPRNAVHPPLNRYRLAAPQLHGILRTQIVDLRLAPGTVISCNDLAVAHAVGTACVEEAMRLLLEESLLDVLNQSVARVSRIDLRQVRQTELLRRAIELELIYELIVRRDRTVTARLRDSLAEQGGYLNVLDFEAFERADQDFHQILYNACDADFMWQKIQLASGHSARLRRMVAHDSARDRTALSQHAALVEALESGSVPRAQDCMRKHLATALCKADELQAQHPAYFET